MTEDEKKTEMEWRAMEAQYYADVEAKMDADAQAPGCQTCRHRSTRKRPKVVGEGGYVDYVEWADADQDEVVYTCRRSPAGGGPVFAGERLDPVAGCVGFEAGSKTGGSGVSDEAMERARARWGAK